MADVALDVVLEESSETQQRQEPKQKGEKRPKSYLHYHEKTTSSHLINVIIEVDKQLANIIYQQAINLFRGEKLDGFKINNTPTEYLEMNYKSEISHRVKQYLFHHFVLDFLIKETHKRRTLVANYPRLTQIHFTPHQNATFEFDVSTTDPIDLKEWRHFSFKMPKRKKYKDLDKQVIHFLEKELSAAKKQQPNTIEEDDWVLFSSSLINEEETLVNNALSNTFWTKISKDTIPSPLAEQFLGKKLNELFTTNCLEFDAQLSNYDGKVFSFLITIKNIVKGKHLYLDHLRSSFKLKNKIEIHNKLMEVFSYRNDISQRKTIIEELFHLFLTKHRFEVPKHLIIRREEDILQTLIRQPDYQVYRAQKDFEQYVELLAEKQIKEEVLIDHIAFKENISVEAKDIGNYLHLFNNKRLKEFIYFKPVDTIEEQTKPINMSILSQAALREKTLNYIIHQLTK